MAAPRFTVQRLDDVDLTFNGRFHIHRELNRGATAVVFEAMDMHYSRKVALKVLNNNLHASEHTGMEVSLEAAEREVESARQLKHPNIVQLLDVFYSSPEKERIVIVWELVQGDDLLEVVNRLNPNMLPEPRARRYFAQLLSGVKHIHANGFCHRDIKPENCMIDAATDTLKVIDFGMTKHLESAKTLMIGTPDYMAPELLTHNLAEAMHGPSPEGEYDPRAVDVWSMGALLFICVTGVFPFEDPRRPNDMCATLENVRNARYRQLPSTVSRDLEDLLHRMLQRKPAARITLEGIGRHPWLQGEHAPDPVPPPRSPPAEQPAKKPRALEKLAAGLGSLRMSQSSAAAAGVDDEAGVQPCCLTPRGGAAKPPSHRRDTATGGEPARHAPKWPRWMALNQGAPAAAPAK